MNLFTFFANFVETKGVTNQNDRLITIILHNDNRYIKLITIVADINS